MYAFEYSTARRVDAVEVYLLRTPDGRESGEIVSPAGVPNRPADYRLPESAPGQLTVLNAVLGGLYIASNNQLPLVIRGDRSLWQPQWGDLLTADEAKARGVTFHWPSATNAPDPEA